MKKYNGKTIKSMVLETYGSYLDIEFTDKTKIRIRPGTQRIHNDTWAAISIKDIK